MAQTASSSFAQHAAELRDQIDGALGDYISPAEGCPDKLGQAIRYAVMSPGKRLRPMLVLMACEACGQTGAAALPAACAVEMVHAYSLVHDDLPAMDDDDLRRGRPSCHKVFGQAMAILAGDALLALAFEVLARGIQPPQAAAACCAALGEAAGPCRLVGGQADDVAAESATATIQTLESIHRRKTGAMIRVSLRLGALVAGADRQQTAALDEYGRQLGLAFQITDDLLDVRGEEAAVGKRVGKDSTHGKLTFPALLGVSRSAAYAQRCIAEARSALDPLGTQGSSLDALAQYVLERNH